MEFTLNENFSHEGPVGGLIGVAETGIKDGLVSKQIAPKSVSINNNIIKITISSVYQIANFAISVYDGGETGLILVVAAPAKPYQAQARYIGIIRTTKFYVKDNSIYINTDSKTNAVYSIFPLSTNVQIKSIESIPRQEFDDSYYEIPVSTII